MGYVQLSTALEISLLLANTRFIPEMTDTEEVELTDTFGMNEFQASKLSARSDCVYNDDAHCMRCVQ